MKIALVGARNRIDEMACTHWSGLDRTLKESEHDHHIFCCRQGASFVQEIINYKPDVIIYGLIDMAQNEEWRERIRFGCPHAKIVFWYTDCRTPETGQKPPVDLRGTVDLFLASNDGLKEFQKKHFGMTPEFMPPAVYPTAEPVFSEEHKREFVFVGSRIAQEGFHHRRDLINEIEEKTNLKIINGTDQVQRARIYLDMPKIYGSAQFTLDVSHFWDIPKYASNRFWVIPGFWGLPLTRRFPGCEELYPEDVRIYWNDVEELIEIMEYLKKDEKTRQKVIKRGHQWCVDHHTYKHRIDAILDMV